MLSAMALPDLETLSLSSFILLSTYTTLLCGQPPNPTPYDSKNPDSMKFAVSRSSLFIRSSIDIIFGVLHALICLTYPSPPLLLCPNTSALNPYLFSWSPRTVISLTAILLGSAIRLSAFRTLGKNFTFRLAKPNALITSGMYKYVQHPSYTGKALIVAGNFMLTQSLGGIMGCWLPAWIVHARTFWTAVALLLVTGIGHVTWKRVTEEETMMKEAFGKEWEEWHTKTARLIPGVF
jgi:protein-S-isoprenylcysteine O-methyltransferase Ste14